MKTVEELYEDIQTIIENGWARAAACALEQLVQTHPQFAQGWFDLAVLQYEAGKKENCLEYFKNAVEHDPDNMIFLKGLADYYFVEAQDPGAAMAVYRQILEKHPADAQILQIAGNLSVVLNRFDDALSYYQQLLEIDPGNEDAAACLEKIQAHSGKQLENENPEQLYQQAQDLAGEGKLAEAIDRLEQVVALDAQYAMAYNDLGVLYHQSGDGDRALANYKRATELEPLNKTFQKNLADFYYVILGRVADALGIYLEMLKSDPEDIEVLTAAGHICCDLGKPEDAEVFFSRVLEIEPWNAPAGEYLQKLTAERQHGNIAGIST